MVVLGDLELAKYPFLADAGEYLKGTGFTLDQLGGDPDLYTIREKAFRRIQTATQSGKVYRSDLGGTAPYALPREVFSFLLAIVLLKLSGARHLVKKFAMQEARAAESFLEKDLGRAATDTQVRLVTKIILDLSGVAVTKRDQHFVIPVHAYLKRAVLFHAKEWKLINRRVERGMVFLTPHETVRLVRQEIINYIAAKIDSAAAPPMVPGLEGLVAKISSINAQFQPRVAVSGEFPPCVKHAINTLKNGENLSHSGRFMLATYLLARGYSPADIVPYFQNAPDYNPSITKYQLNHLAGGSGSGTKYMCQSCDKLRALNHCHATPDCDGITNPTQFGGKK